MKKILARLAQGDPDDSSGGTTSLTHSGFIGRQFHLGQFVLVVEEVIAEGGFGVVFRVRSQFGNVYALKRMCVNNERDLSVCKRELTIVSSLSHKNILHYIDSSITQTQKDVYEILLLTAYYPKTLKQVLRDRLQTNQHLSESDVLHIFCDICEAVCRLHHCKTPIIHRDLKIENILIDDHRNFVLCDFGSATSRVLYPVTHGVRRCQDEINKYTTLSYRAPELVDLHGAVPLGPKIDIWAMGCILYFLCFIRLPFGENALAIQSGNYTIPDTSFYSDRLHKLIGYLLTVDATQRPDIFQTCALAFSLSKRTNPAQNLYNLPIPRWDDLPSSKPEQKASRPTVESTKNSTSGNASHFPDLNSSNPKPKSAQKDTMFPYATITNTSINPRQRPRPNLQIKHNDIQVPTISPAAAATEDTTSSTRLGIKPPPPASRTRLSAEVTEVADWPNESAHLPFASDLFWPTMEPDPIPIDTVAVNHSQPPPRGHHRAWSIDAPFTEISTNPFHYYQPRPLPGFTTNAAILSQRPLYTQVSPMVVPQFNVPLRQAQSLHSLPMTTAARPEQAPHTIRMGMSPTLIYPYPAAPTLSPNYSVPPIDYFANKQ